MTDSSDGESVGDVCVHIGRDSRPACDDLFFFVWLQFALQRHSVYLLTYFTVQSPS